MSDSTFGYVISAAAAALLLMGLLNALTNAADYCKSTDRLRTTTGPQCAPHDA